MESIHVSVVSKTADPEKSQDKLDKAISEAVGWLEENQNPEGFWVGMLQSNSCMEAEWVLAMHFLGISDDPKYDAVVRCILSQQRQDGSWEVYYDADEGNINTTVECYAALRAAGFDDDHPALQKARLWIFDHGGIAEIRVFTKYWLALIGEWPWRDTPMMPPELIFLPHWAPLNIYRFASWARATMVPIAILCAQQPVKRLPESQRLDELFPNGRDKFDFRLPNKAPPLSVEKFFLIADRLLQLYSNSPIQPGRDIAIKQCVEWIIRHQEADGAWSGIQPPWIYSLIALKNAGYPLDHSVLKSGLRAFDKHWSYENDGNLFLQASESPVWDTLLSMNAMLDCDESLHKSDAMKSALTWILNEQVKVPGDWSVYEKNTPPGGWSFERANDLYPDVDDTALAIIVLARMRRLLEESSEINKAIDRAVRWILAIQCSNGGWGAFDRDNSSEIVTKIPFCDFGEVLDPPSVDVTAHVVESLALAGHRIDSKPVKRAIEYIKREQEADGSWFGRWGVNHIYGTAAVLPALGAIGQDMTAQFVIRAGDWIAEHQNEDGGWGETCASYMDDSLRGVGKSTPSQTAWAIMALLAAKTKKYDDAIRRGVDFLVKNQVNGTWDEPEFTGTGFPGYGLGRRVNVSEVGEKLGQGTELGRAFMINYHLYRHYFPLAAIGRAKKRFRHRSTDG